MRKKKNGGFLSRLIWTILIVGFFVLGAVLFVSTLPTVGVLINYTQDINLLLTTITISASIALKGFGALFGGALDEYSFNASASSGDSVSEIPGFEVPSIGEEFNFNYVVLIGVILALIGIFIAVLFFKKKSFSLLASLFIIAGAILLCLDSFIFKSINQDSLDFLDNVEGLSIIDVPSLLFGISSAVSGILVFFHALILKK